MGFVVEDTDADVTPGLKLDPGTDDDSTIVAVGCEVDIVT
jgi:hypothetical protein